MSFNFNWSPLIADTSRAKEMLTAALNKSPKPPIIVDDIIVSELNLGETPPDLEILEIGDLAEDRFRGIFKMSYTGDAYLTLKTRVQANPLNTYLSTKPSFASPQPLAAASGLTIPLAITLSDIRLSGFVILVFSKHKGMTLVFRNDPLESLKVSSTFDSIPFVRDYLQREIEKQLRNLFMEDLPAILHRLSLRLWSPEYRELDDKLMDAGEDKTAPVDPLASPPQDPSDWSNIGIDSVPSFSLDPSDPHASFSQKNLLRLAALSDSHRTLSLFTPPIKDAVFRAWAGASERGSSGLQTPIHATLPTLSRAGSYLSSAASTSSVLSDPASETYSRTSTSYTFHGTTSRYGHRPRKAKKRVINLRKQAVQTETHSMPVTASTTPEPSIAPSSAPSVIYEENQEDQLATPPRTPLHPPRRHRSSSLDTSDPTPRASLLLPKEKKTEPAPPGYTPPFVPLTLPAEEKKPQRPRPLSMRTFPAAPASSSSGDIPSLLRTLSSEKMAFGQSPVLAAPFSPTESTTSSGGILEQAWMTKIAKDIERKLEEERKKKKASGKNREVESKRTQDLPPPPAYAA